MSQGGVIDSLQFARAARELRGRVGLAQMTRLAGMQCSTEGLDFHLWGGKASNGRHCLRVSVRGNVQLQCQRCLDPLPVAISLDVELQIAESLREIAAADDDIDRVLASRSLDIGQLIEDEVILALPMSPRHETCVTHPLKTQV
jgi:uncharacterized protein